MAKVVHYVIELPLAEDELGRWCDEHGAAITLTCILGTWEEPV